MSRLPLTKNYCFTGWVHKGALSPEWFWNKYGDKTAKPQIAYICGKLEKSTTDKIHWQRWVQFVARKRPTAVHKIFPLGEFFTKACKGTEEHNQTYCQKTATQLEEFVSFGAFSVQGKANPMGEIEELVKGGVSKRELWDQYFSTMSTRYRGIYEGMAQLDESGDSNADFTLAEFGWEPLKFGQQTAEDNGESMTWVLAGPAGIGKTEFALAHFKNALIVKNLNQLAEFDKFKHDGIVFDDFDSELSKLERTTQVHLLEQRRTSGIRILYQVVKVPGKTRKVFTTNIPDGDIFIDHPSVTRRHRVRILGDTVHPKKVESAVGSGAPGSPASVQSDESFQGLDGPSESDDDSDPGDEDSRSQRERQEDQRPMGQGFSDFSDDGGERDPPGFSRFSSDRSIQPTPVINSVPTLPSSTQSGSASSDLPTGRLARTGRFIFK